MKRNLPLILIPVLVTVVCGTLSFLAGHYVPWTPLGTPPEPAVEILRATGGSVIVESSSGKAYDCIHQSGRSIGDSPNTFQPGNCNWQEINLADFGPGAIEEDETCVYFLPPGRVADRFYVCKSPGWRYVVLTDGSVWALPADDGDFTIDDLPGLYIQAAFIFLGPIVSLFLGFATFHFLWRRRPRQG